MVNIIAHLKYMGAFCQFGCKVHFLWDTCKHILKLEGLRNIKKTHKFI